jgi:predicted DNA-binding transcriptional regulator AlpA
LSNHLSQQDPDRIVPVAEACGILGIGRSTCYRISLPRVQLSPGRVGFRLGDLLQYLADNSGNNLAAFEQPTNFATYVPGETDAVKLFAALDHRVRAIMVRKPTGAFEGATIHLPPVATWGGGIMSRDLIIIDRDAVGRIELVAAEGELVNGRSAFVAGGSVRLTPLLSADPEQNDEWWVA